MADETHGTGTDNQQGGNGPEPLNEEKVASIAAQVVNQAFTNRSKKLREEITADFTRGFEGVNKTLAELTAALPQPKGVKKKEGEAELDHADSPVLKGLQRQLEELRNEATQLKAERDAERTQSKNMTLRQKLGDELARAGINDPQRVRYAMALLVSEEQRVRWSEDGESIVFRDATGEDIDLATGIKTWAKSEDGKHFLPPTGARGSGDRQGQGRTQQQQGTKEPSATDLGLAIAEAFAAVPVG
jgi:hypothetical protein